MNCPECHTELMFNHGEGWDYDRWICMNKGCHYEFELEESTYWSEKEILFGKECEWCFTGSGHYMLEYDGESFFSHTRQECREKFKEFIERGMHG